MRVTIHDVASHAGVSAMTVSRVINESPRVSTETRKRVEASIAKLGHVPNRLARGLIQRKTGAFGVIVPDVANPFFTLVVRGVEQVAWRADHHVILCDTQGDLERERGYLEDMIAYQVDGVAGARRLVDHLIGLGHRRIGMITESAEVSTARDRLRGYREALESAGLGFDPELVAPSSTIDPDVACKATLGLLARPAPPTAIFAVNNIAVVGVVEGARQRRLEIPSDLALVCFDDIEHVSRLYPFLTVMAQPAETFGTIATQLLLDRLGGRIGQRRRIVVLPADFIVRESSGALASDRAEA